LKDNIKTFRRKEEVGSRRSSDKKPKFVGSKIIDDVLTDDISRFKPRFEVDHEAYIRRLWESNPQIHQLLKNAVDIEKARDALFHYLDDAEKRLFDIKNDLHIFSKSVINKNIIKILTELRDILIKIQSLLI